MDNCETEISKELNTDLIYSAAFASIEILKYIIYKRTSEYEYLPLYDYLEYLKLQKTFVKGRKGSVAVNCNPMTIGHLHLLQYVASEVEFLFVFVIEDDKSYFSFDTRFSVVKKALMQLENVKVIKGGRYIRTELTFPEYFEKNGRNEVLSDASMEVWFFCEHIAKALDISIFFLGEEPSCENKNQYNSKMKEILPSYKIEVDIIPRLSYNQTIVSASLVRKLLEQKKFSEIKYIVPDATYEYLKNSS